MFRLDPQKKEKSWLQQGWTYSFCIFFASVRLDEAEIASQWIHHFRWPPFWQIQSPWLGRNPHVFQVVSNSCPRRRPEHHRGFGQHGQFTAQSMLNDPKYGWKMQNMSQTTNQVTIAAFFRPTRIDRTKNTPAIQRVVSHLKKRDKTIRLE